MNTRYVLFSMLFCSVFMLFSCSKDEVEVEKIAASDKGTWVDERDGETYHWARYGSTDWMTDNFRYAVSGAAVYLNYEDREGQSDKNLARYGRLYNRRQALEACPEGWRLPTDDDWKALEQALGMSASDVSLRDWRGNIASNMITVKDESSDLSLLLGGYNTDHTVMGMTGFRFMGTLGFYWTSTKDTEKEGEYYFYRKLSYTRQGVYRESMEPEKQYLSVRYVRDAK